MVKMTNNLKDIDKQLGLKIMNLRVSGGYSMTKIADFLGVTHQQIQKYEKGINRICVGRLILIAKFFKVDLNFFYTDLENFKEESAVEAVKHRQSLEIFKLLKDVDNEELKKSICNLIKVFLKTENKILKHDMFDKLFLN